MLAASSSFSSVKLSSGWVNKARDAASSMSRSVAGQIEYWATLGRRELRPSGPGRAPDRAEQPPSGGQGRLRCVQVQPLQWTHMATGAFDE